MHKQRKCKRLIKLGVVYVKEGNATIPDMTAVSSLMFEFLNYPFKFKKEVRSAQQTAPIDGLPAEMCREIWSYLDRDALMAATLVSKQFHLFSLPFIIQTESSNVLDFEYKRYFDVTSEKNHNELTKFSLVVSIYDVGTSSIQNFDSDIDAGFIMFENANEASVKSILPNINRYCKGKRVTQPLPILVYAESPEKHMQLSKIKDASKIEDMEIYCDSYELCSHVSWLLSGSNDDILLETFSHKCNRKGKFLVGTATFAICSYIMTIATILPSLLLLISTDNMSASLSFSVILLCLGLIMFIVATSACISVARNWYHEPQDVSPRYRQSCFCPHQYAGCV